MFPQQNLLGEQTTVIYAISNSCCYKVKKEWSSEVPVLFFRQNRLLNGQGSM